MEKPKRDASMIVRAAIGKPLISRETALAICRMVVADLRGEDERRAQEPFTVEDGSDVWIVHGAITIEPDAVPGDPSPIRMAISKFDGAIVSFFD